MKWIVVTSPSFFDGEEQFVKTLLSSGVDLVHLRKPEGDRHRCEQLLKALSDDERRRIVAHDFLELATPYGLGGVHLNRRNSKKPRGFEGTVSCSCHSIDEVRARKEEFDYLFLSPIFDSISKEGYRSAFSEKDLDEAARLGVIDDRVVALGGVTPEAIPLLRRWHFGGAAMLGFVNRLSSLPEAEIRQCLQDISPLFHPTQPSAK